ncbi:hypothetical protein OT109_08960 [Phycisphaeraceae bacterium D3-23]
MAIYSTLFLATSDDLLQMFPDWKAPLSTPRDLVVRNPFTGEEKRTTSTEPEWKEEENIVLSKHDVVGIEGDYLRFLEQRIPDSMRERPHICSKGFTHIEYEPLSSLLGIEPLLEPAFYAPPSAGAIVLVFNDPFRQTLAEIDDDRTSDIAFKWAEAMSSPEYTCNRDGKQIAEGWAPEFASSVLEPLKAISTDGWRNELCLFLLIEF